MPGWGLRGACPSSSTAAGSGMHGGARICWAGAVVLWQGRGGAKTSLHLRAAPPSFLAQTRSSSASTASTRAASLGGTSALPPSRHLLLLGKVLLGPPGC